jgi:hypothetical protein
MMNLMFYDILMHILPKGTQKFSDVWSVFKERAHSSDCMSNTLNKIILTYDISYLGHLHKTSFKTLFHEHMFA